MKLIGISGEKGVGKDTAADILVKRYGFTKLSLAKPLKDLCCQLTGLAYDTFDNPSTKDKVGDRIIIDGDLAVKLLDISLGESNHAINLINNTYCFSPREVLQFIGTDIARRFKGDEYWTNKFIELYKNTPGKVVVSDVRFGTDRRCIKRLGGTLIRIKTNRFTPTGSSTHISENDFGLDTDYDSVMTNNDDIAGLETNVSIWYDFKSKL